MVRAARSRELGGAGQTAARVGGAKDLASGANRLIVTMIHATRKGASKIVPRCKLPLTARGVVDMVRVEERVM